MRVHSNWIRAQSPHEMRAVKHILFQKIWMKISLDILDGHIVKRPLDVALGVDVDRRLEFCDFRKYRLTTPIKLLESNSLLSFIFSIFAPRAKMDSYWMIDFRNYLFIVKFEIRAVSSLHTLYRLSDRWESTWNEEVMARKYGFSKSHRESDGVALVDLAIVHCSGELGHLKYYL